MRKFLPAFFLFALFPQSVIAVDLFISDPIISNLEVSLNASLSGSANYYLQGTLRSQSSSKYFGETQNNRGDWVDYISTPEKEYITSNFFLTDIKNATWSGTIKLRFKLDDPNYFGPGQYDLKLRRFTGNSTSNAGESNTLTLNLTQVIPTPTPSFSPSPPPTPPPTPTPSPTPTPPPSLRPSLSPWPSLSPALIGTVAGETTMIDLSAFGLPPSSSPAPSSISTQPSLNRSRAQTALFAGTGLILTSLAGYFGYRLYLRRHPPAIPEV